MKSPKINLVRESGDMLIMDMQNACSGLVRSSKHPRTLAHATIRTKGKLIRSEPRYSPDRFANPVSLC